MKPSYVFGKEPVRGCAVPLVRRCRVFTPRRAGHRGLASPEQVVFEHEELAKIRNVGPKGLVLLGFKPRSAIKRKHQVRHAAFLYPSDKVCRARGEGPRAWRPAV